MEQVGMNREEYVQRFADYVVGYCGEEMREEAVRIAESWWDDETMADRADPKPEDDAATEMSYWEP